MNALLLLVSCSTFSGLSGSKEEDLSCGVNARAEDGDCVCQNNYDWCDERGGDCCAWDARAYDLRFTAMTIAPYDMLYTGDPWDWDGDIPDWLIEALSTIGYIYPEAGTAAEVLELVDEYAPQLLEGVVPPDVFYEVYQYDQLIDANDAQDDSYNPNFRGTLRISPDGDDDIILALYDEDLSWDDDLQFMYLDRTSMAWLSGRGTVFLPIQQNVHSMEVEVEPVW